MTTALKFDVLGAALGAALAFNTAGIGTAEARQGPGFDCSKAHQPLARLICADDDLSEIDLKLNQAYDGYRDTLDAVSKKRLAQDENIFIRNVIASCPIPTVGQFNEGAPDALSASRCVAKAYIERTATLRRLAQGAVAPVSDNAATIPQQSTLQPQDQVVTPPAETVQLEPEHGVFMLPVRINDAVTIPFVLDSGAADVSVPEDVFKTLLRTRTVTESDFLSPGTYINADGSERSKQRFTLHELRVGNYVIRDLAASVAPDKANPLLGQSFLGKLPGWTIDNTKHTLVIGVAGEAERARALTASVSPVVSSPKSILADGVLSARSSVGAVLRKNGGGLAANRSSCPSQNLFDRSNDDWEYVEKTQVVPVNGTSDAILIDSGMCNGGNGHGQYLVIAQNGSAHVITDAEIADMSFLGRISRVEGTSVFLTGARWGPDDPHCCPSREATLEYDIRTGQHTFTLGKRLR